MIFWNDSHDLFYMSDGTPESEVRKLIKGISLSMDNNLNRIFDISITSDNKVCFQEACNKNYDVCLSKDEAIKALNEAIDWVNQNAT